MTAAVVEEGGHAAEAAVNAMTTICGSLDRAAQATSSLGEKVRRIDGSSA
ncbi:MAG TPA: hypothetical protein VEB43_01905 [Anaeromyxobacter sp.]|nr:hypothetical protein [Anaeromyxobacter sp.]